MADPTPEIMAWARGIYTVISTDNQGRLLVEDSTMREGSQFRRLRCTDTAHLDRIITSRARVKMAVLAMKDFADA